MNWEEFGRKRPWPNFKVLFRLRPGGTEEKLEKPMRLSRLLAEI
jgi:hypothetical protein